jgi:hypothetical protein
MEYQRGVKGSITNHARRMAIEPLTCVANTGHYFSVFNPSRTLLLSHLPPTLLNIPSSAATTIRISNYLNA